MYTTFGTYYFLDGCLLSWLDWNPTRTTESWIGSQPGQQTVGLESNQDNRQPSKKNNKYQMLYP
jgi:hypothetical protein